MESAYKVGNDQLDFDLGKILADATSRPGRKREIGEIVVVWPRNILLHPSFWSEFVRCVPVFRVSVDQVVGNDQTCPSRYGMTVPLFSVCVEAHGHSNRRIIPQYFLQKGLEVLHAVYNVRREEALAISHTLYVCIHFFLYLCIGG